MLTFDIGFEFGSTQLYDGTGLVTQSSVLRNPIVYVAVNYRVGGFGFLAGKELQSEGSTNLGLRDQRLALEWVQDNIANFGGDPAKVTIWVSKSLLTRQTKSFCFFALIVLRANLLAPFQSSVRLAFAQSTTYAN